MSQRFNTNRGSRRLGERGVTLVEMAVSTLTFYSIILYSVGVVLIMNETSVVTQQVLIGSINGSTDNTLTPVPANDLFLPQLANDEAAEDALSSANINPSSIQNQALNSTLGLAKASDAKLASTDMSLPDGYNKGLKIVSAAASDSLTVTLTSMFKLPFPLPGFPSTFEVSASTITTKVSSVDESKYCGKLVDGMKKTEDALC